MSNDVIEILEVHDSNTSTIPVLIKAEENHSNIEFDVVYCLSSHAMENINTLQLAEFEWNIFFAFGSGESVRTLAGKLSLPQYLIRNCLYRLIACHLVIPKNTMSHAEYKAKSSKLMGLNYYSLKTEEEFQFTIPLDDTSNETTIVEIDTTNNIAQKKEKIEEQPIPSGKLKTLRCLVETICRFKGDDRRGKLAVYRIFLRVPREDFVSLGFGSFLFLNENERDESNVSPELLERLLFAAKQELGKDPEIIYQELYAAGRLPQSCIQH